MSQSPVNRPTTPNPDTAVESLPSPSALFATTSSVATSPVTLSGNASDVTRAAAPFTATATATAIATATATVLSPAPTDAAYNAEETGCGVSASATSAISNGVTAAGDENPDADDLQPKYTVTEIPGYGFTVTQTVGGQQVPFEAPGAAGLSPPKTEAPPLSSADIEEYTKRRASGMLDILNRNLQGGNKAKVPAHASGANILDVMW